MSHSHHHDHDHAAPTNFNKAFAIAVTLNFLFTLVQAGYAIVADSMSLLADAGHNFGDVFGLALAWGANWLLSKPSSERYSYGYKRTTIIASIINALLLVGTSAIIAYESINKLMHPSIVNEKIVILVAFIGIIINSGSALLFLRGRKEDLNIKGAYLHLASDALISIGVVVAGILIYYTKWYWIDPIVGLFIIIVILAGTWGLLRHSLSLLLDAVPADIDQAGVASYLANIHGVTAVHDLHIWGLSTREVALTAHLVMPEQILSDQDYARINHELQCQFKIEHVTLQVEKGDQTIVCSQHSSC